MTEIIENTVAENKDTEVVDKISIDDFHKVDIRVGEIMSAEKVPDTDKLLRLKVRFGKIKNVDAVEEQNEERQIVSGIAAYFPDPAALVGKKVAFAYNLAPRIIRGLESNGMILGALGDDGSFSLLEATSAAGSKVQ